MFPWSKASSKKASVPFLEGAARKARVHKDLQPGDVVVTIRNPKQIEALGEDRGRVWLSAQVFKTCGEKATVVNLATKGTQGNQAEDRYVLRFPDGQTFTRCRAYIATLKKTSKPKVGASAVDQAGGSGFGWPAAAAQLQALRGPPNFTKGEAVLTFRNTKAVADLGKEEVWRALLRTGEAAHIVEEADPSSIYDVVLQFADNKMVRRRKFYLLKLSEVIERESAKMENERGLSAKSIYSTFLSEEMELATEKVQSQMQHAEEQARQEVAEKLKRAEMKANAEANRWLKETRETVEEKAFSFAKKAAGLNAVEEIRRMAVERLDKEAEKNAKFGEESGFPLNEAARNYCVSKWTSEDSLWGVEDKEFKAGIGLLGTFRLDYAVLQQATDGFAEDHLLGRGGSCRVFKGKVYGHLVAIKVFNEDGGSWDDKQIQAEIKLLCNVRHPHINKLLAVSFNGDHRCLVLEYMDGGSLDARVFAKPLLLWKERAAILLHTARGLAHLHSLNPPIVHRGE
jgi:hypothetical protein